MRFRAFLGASAALAAAWWAAGVVPARTEAPPKDILIFAAASLQTAIDELAEPIRRATGTSVRMSYAASSALARQIVEGAPADLFMSADADWMDYLAERRLIRTGSRVNLLGNRLVLIAPRDRPIQLAIAPGFELAKALGPNRLAMANPDAVPAGRYAHAALTRLGVWDGVSNRIAAAENVRAALLLVSRGEAPLGIVYATDAIAEPRVVVVDTFPATSHPAIVYPAALTAAASPAAAAVLAYLISDAAWPAFEKQGFTRPGPR
ncbi:MAG TPA: molybdate ABC transporter substrate-binding protein [Vicinamibacterales bacterium]|nr:molybdate ABC transporter substrate-binding protein [Vicinamibacterales bacterium]